MFNRNKTQRHEIFQFLHFTRRINESRSHVENKAAQTQSHDISSKNQENPSVTYPLFRKVKLIFVRNFSHQQPSQSSECFQDDGKATGKCQSKCKVRKASQISGFSFDESFRVIGNSALPLDQMWRRAACLLDAWICRGVYWYIIGSVTCSTNPDRRVADRTSSGVRRGDRRLNTDGLPGHAVKRKMDLPLPNSYSFALNTDITRVCLSDGISLHSMSTFYNFSNGEIEHLQFLNNNNNLLLNNWHR